jgi:hypothetical protein
MTTRAYEGVMTNSLNWTRLSCNGLPHDRSTLNSFQRALTRALDGALPSRWTSLMATLVPLSSSSVFVRVSASQQLPQFPVNSIMCQCEHNRLKDLDYLPKPISLSKVNLDASLQGWEGRKEGSVKLTLLFILLISSIRTLRLTRNEFPALHLS